MYKVKGSDRRSTEKAASITGKTISAYILNTALSSAKKDIEQMESITLGDKDRDMFYSLITNPKESISVQNFLKKHYCELRSKGQTNTVLNYSYS
ncbi:MAG: DUF1778 domain-containing protein [Spirochaetaceae bacterium]|nr:DUF1778 domain-containing protein [Spirochaetaceae bacterium]